MALPTDGLLETEVAPPSDGSATAPGPDAIRDAAVLAIGATLGRYQITGVLGAGGMGRVYRARDPDLDRDLAIKVLRRAPGGSGSSGLEQRLLREAQAMAKLNHPNLATAYDVGTVRGEVFIAFEFIDGTTLAAWAREPHRSGERLAALIKAGRGLEAAHAAGVIHRDFKPDNVLVGRDGVVKVIDFGLARGVGDRGDHGGARADDGRISDLTATGSILGTPAYMAPEQLRGELADAHADQFGFAVTAWEILYGARPFQAETFGELLTAVSAGRIEPPPADTEVPPAVARALRRALAVAPAQRFPDLTALLAALAAAVAAPRRGRRWAVPVAVGVALVAAIPIALIVARGRGRAPGPRAIDPPATVESLATGTGAGTGAGSATGTGAGGGTGAGTGAARPLPPPSEADRAVKTQLRAVVKANIAAVSACYETALAADPTIGAGVVRLEFEISPIGRVVSTRLVADDFDGRGKIASCLGGVSLGWTFPAPTSGGTIRVQWPFSFGPGAADHGPVDPPDRAP